MFQGSANRSIGNVYALDGLALTTATPGRLVEDLPRSLGQQHRQLLFGQSDVLLELLPAA